jgi:hypothetical protein
VLDPPDAGAHLEAAAVQGRLRRGDRRCIAQGGKKRKCRRQTLKTCRKQGSRRAS